MRVSSVPCPPTPYNVLLIFLILLLFQVRLRLPDAKLYQISVPEGGEGSFDALLTFTLAKAPLMRSE
jgi:hypothetical protein